MAKLITKECYFTKNIIYILMIGVWLMDIFPQIEGKVFMCYWGSMSHYREGKGHISIDDVDPNLCTHIIYSYATINKQNFKMESSHPVLDHGPSDSPIGTEDMFRKFVALKSKNMALKVLLSVGGGNVTSQVFSDMVAISSNRKIFINSVVEIMKKFEFDGLDIDWKYPTIGYGAIPADKDKFVILLQELRNALNSFEPKRLLTAAIWAGIDIIDVAYNVPEIEKSLDFLNVMAFDFKLYQDKTPLIGHHSPLYNSGSRDDVINSSLTVDYTIQNLLGRVGDIDKIILGIATYGRTYTLKNSNRYNFYDEAQGPGVNYPYTQEPGIIAYFEICQNLTGVYGWEFEFDDDYKIPYAYKDTQWIGYDNELSAIGKVDYAINTNLGGVMIWSLDLDDCRNYCGGWGGNCHISQAAKNRFLHLTSNNNVSATSANDLVDAIN